MRPEPVTVSAPGRVNLIGEHTDYSLLPVLPIAIQKRLQVHAEATSDRVVEARSEQFDGIFRSDPPRTRRGRTTCPQSSISSVPRMGPA